MDRISSRSASARSRASWCGSPPPKLPPRKLQPLRQPVISHRQRLLPCREVGRLASPIKTRHPQCTLRLGNDVQLHGEDLHGLMHAKLKHHAAQFTRRGIDNPGGLRHTVGIPIGGRPQISETRCRIIDAIAGDSGQACLQGIQPFELRLVGNIVGHQILHEFLHPLTQKRDALMQHLQEREIGCIIHYPIPIHLQKAYATMGWKPGDFPVAEAAAGEILSLPLFPTMTDEQVDTVVTAIKEFFVST